MVHRILSGLGELASLATFVAMIMTWAAVFAGPHV